MKNRKSIVESIIIQAQVSFSTKAILQGVNTSVTNNKIIVKNSQVYLHGSSGSKMKYL